VGVLIEPRDQLEPAPDVAAGDGAAPTGRVADTATDGPPAHAGRASPAAQRTVDLTGLAAIAALAVPVAVALVALRDPYWHANLDLALTELRVRDVTSGHPPLVGLSGRIEALGLAGSHPGPISFWLLAPLYRLFGASSWALQAATATLNLAAVAVAVWIGHRRGGRAGALAVAAGMAVLLHAYGADRWTQAWNPYLPLMWWPVVLLAVWSVLCDDHTMLPVAVAAGTFCLQTHVAYLGLVAGVLGLAAAGLAVALARTGGSRRDRMRTLRWGGSSAALLVLLWVPPLVEQARHDPGNLTIIREQFANPTEPSAGWRAGVETSLQRLDLVSVLAGRADQVGSSTRGALMLVMWGVAAAVAWRRARHVRALLRLQVVVAAALLLGLVSISRIQGTVFDYLVLWSWGTAVLAAAAVAWTVAEVRSEGRARAAVPEAEIRSTGRAGSAEPESEARVDVGRLAPVRRGGPALGLALALHVVLVVALAATTWDAAHAQHPQPGQARLHADLLPDAVEALRRGPAPGAGTDGHYLVRSDDPLSVGLNSYTVLLELERQGFEVGIDGAHAVSARPFRVMPGGEATAIVTYVVGPAIAGWRQRSGAVEIAHAEPSADDRADFERLRRRVVAELERDGLGDLAAQVDDSALTVGVDPRVPASTATLLRRMIDLSGPTSIFVTLPVT
jgi:hypothetical protein